MVALQQQENSISRALVLHALRESGRNFRIAYTSFSLAGIRAAALAGLAIAALPASAVGDGLRSIDKSAALPRLGTLNYIVVHRRRSSIDQAFDQLYQALLQIRSPP